MDQVGQFVHHHVIHDFKRQQNQLPGKVYIPLAGARPPAPRSAGDSNAAAVQVIDIRKPAHPLGDVKLGLAPVPINKDFPAVFEVAFRHKKAILEFQLGMMRFGELQRILLSQIIKLFSRNKSFGGIFTGMQTGFHQFFFNPILFFNNEPLDLFNTAVARHPHHQLPLPRNLQRDTPPPRFD